MGRGSVDDVPVQFSTLSRMKGSGTCIP